MEPKIHREGNKGANGCSDLSVGFPHWPGRIPCAPEALQGYCVIRRSCSPERCVRPLVTISHSSALNPGLVGVCHMFSTSVSIVHLFGIAFVPTPPCPLTFTRFFVWKCLALLAVRPLPVPHTVARGQLPRN